jgi:hypothetical protein
MVVLVGMAFTITAVAPLTRWHGQGNFAAAGRLVGDRPCVYTDAVSLALAADVFRLPSARCPGWIDGRGVNLTENTRWPRGVPFYPRGFVANAAWQRENLRQLMSAQYALIRGRAQAVREWSAQTRAYFLGNFRLLWEATGRVPAQLWVRSAVPESGA